jgi:hypothetical protein
MIHPVDKYRREFYNDLRGGLPWEQCMKIKSLVKRKSAGLTNHATATFSTLVFSERFNIEEVWTSGFELQWQSD